MRLFRPRHDNNRRAVPAPAAPPTAPRPAMPASIRPASPESQASAADALPDPAQPPQARGTWEHAALVNVDITEVVKRQVGAVTPPWRK